MSVASLVAGALRPLEDPRGIITGLGRTGHQEVRHDPVRKRAAASRLGPAALAAAVLTAASSIAWAAIPGNGGVIHACYAQSGGALRMIDVGPVEVDASEVKLTAIRVGTVHVQ
jgi:hypothetical protein